MASKKRQHPKPQPIERPLWEWISVAIVCGLLIAGAGNLYYHYQRTRHEAHPYSSIERLPGTFRFEPKPDITAYELALSISAMMGSVNYLEQMRKFYDLMPPDAKRHWLTPETGPPAPPPPDHNHDHPHKE